MSGPCQANESASHEFFRWIHIDFLTLNTKTPCHTANTELGPDDPIIRQCNMNEFTRCRDHYEDPSNAAAACVTI